MIMWILIFIIIGLSFWNILYYIPNKLKTQEEKLSLQFRELHARFNRLEDTLESKE